MIAIQDTLVSEHLLEKQFVCDLEKCKGACCVAGVSGAPLNEDELPQLDAIYESVKPYLSERGIAAIEAQGRYLVDADGEYVTPLINEVEECAYTIYNEKGIAMCGIEKAYNEKKINWQKPISCHLYPVRITKYKAYDAVNYEKWSVCKPACKLGETLQVPVYKFLANALTRKYGKDWYDELCHVANHYNGRK